MNRINLKRCAYTLAQLQVTHVTWRADSMWGCTEHAAGEVGSAWNLRVSIMFRGSDFSLYELGNIEGVQIRGMLSSHLNFKDNVEKSEEEMSYCNVLGWPKSSFRFFPYE